MYCTPRKILPGTVIALSTFFAEEFPFFQLGAKLLNYLIQKFASIEAYNTIDLLPILNRVRSRRPERLITRRVTLLCIMAAANPWQQRREDTLKDKSRKNITRNISVILLGDIMHLRPVKA